MKRDWDIIRDILLKLEDLEPSVVLEPKDFPSDKISEYAYNANLLLEAGLVHGGTDGTLMADLNHFWLSRLTWDGHELLDAIRDDSIWNRTKNRFASEGISMTFDLVKNVATEISAALLRRTMAGV